LYQDRTCKDFLQVAQEGNVIISVGYRVKSIHGTRFRQFPTVKLKDIQNIHDRFIIVDETVYHIGSSLNELGKNQSLGNGTAQKIFLKRERLFCLEHGFSAFLQVEEVFNVSCFPDAVHA